MDLSVVLITLNEESNLGRCLKGLPQGAEIIIVDSGSTDRTEEIARQYGARFCYRKFDNYSNQKNHAIALASRTWVLSMDADEVLSEQCAHEIGRIILSNPDAGFRINRCLHFMGKKMRFGKTKDSPLRLFPRGKGYFVGAIHESIELNISTRLMKMSSRAIVYHYSYSDLNDYFEKFNRYTARIASNHLERNRSAPPQLLIALRPWLEFIGRFFLRGGFLDGYPGYVYALLSSFYAFVKYEKLRQLSAQSDFRRFNRNK